VLFPTATFAVFFAVVLPLSWLLMPRQHAWRPFMLLASYFFYGWWDWRFCFLLAGSTIGNQLFALGIARQPPGGRRKALLGLAVAFNLGLLGYFKYAGFFLSSAENLLSDLGIDAAFGVVSVTLPVGISFFTFCALSYVIDIYRGVTRPTTLPKFAVFLSFFPHLVAGPIVRASELVPQLDSPRDARRIDVGRAFLLIGTGLFLKVVIDNFLADRIVDDVFGTPDRYSSFEVLVGIYGYSVQIFADFCGYTNMAIGLALLLGFRFPQNFDNPYTALSIRDFWRRWHMTLSRWLRDYLYIPLGGNRKGPVRTYVNLMAVMLIGGLWHGAAWTFVVWGGMHGAMLCAEHWWAERRARLGLPPPRDDLWARVAKRFIVFNLVCVAWVFFRADSFANAADVLGRLWGHWGEGAALVTPAVILAIAVGIGGQYLPKGVGQSLMAGFSRWHPVAQGAALALALVIINSMGPQGVAPFIYFRF